jgi:hypothetical protein
VALGALLLLCVALLVLVGRPLATDDLWWHLALGREYASHGPWLPEDPLYHTTANQPTVPHEWLYQIALHRLQRIVGFQGLRVVHVLAVAALLAAVFALLRRAAGSLAVASLATMAFAAVSWFRLFQLRPDLVSVAGMLGLYALLLRDEGPPSWRRVGAALLLLVLWANMHSVFAIGPALLVAALLGLALRSLLRRTLVPGAPAGGPDEAARGDAAAALRLAVALALGLLVTAANPRGFAQHATFFVESRAGDIWLLADDFLPWNPLRPVSGNLALSPLAWGVADAILVAFAACAAANLVRLARGRSARALEALDAVHLGLGAAALVAMLLAVRFHWMALFPILYVLRFCAGRERVAGVARRPLARLAAAAALLLALLFPLGNRFDLFAAEVAVERDGYRSPWLDERYGGPGTRFLRDAGLRGNLFHPFNLGGFLGYWLAPDLRIFIDGRMDHYPSEVLEDYLRIRRASQRGAPRVLRELLDEWDVDVFFGTSFPEEHYEQQHWIAHLRRFPEWALVFASRNHSVYLRRTRDNVRNFSRVKAYYAQRLLADAFDTRRGLDVATLIRRRPNWARRQGLIPPDFDRLQAERQAADPERRALALDALGRLYWQLGDFADGVEVDAELARLRPEWREPRRRLADGLLQLGRADEALPVARALYEEDPGYGDVFTIYEIARHRAPDAAR